MSCVGRMYALYMFFVFTQSSVQVVLDLHGNNV